MESNDKERIECISILKSLIAPEKGGMQIFRLEKSYAEEIGSRIPYAKYGYSSLNSFLLSIPEIHTDKMNMLHVRDPKMAHITAMVEAQRSNSNKKPMRSKRPMFQSGGRSTGRPSYSGGSRPPSNFSRPGASSYSYPTKKTSFSVSQSRKPPMRYNPAQGLLGKMPTVEYVNGKAIQTPITTEYNNNVVVRKPATVEYNRTPSSPKNYSSPKKALTSPRKSAPVVVNVNSTPTKKTTIEYDNGIATTYIDGVEVKKAPIYNNTEPTQKVEYQNDYSAKVDQIEKPNSEEFNGSNNELPPKECLSLQVNGRRRMIPRPSRSAVHQSDMRDIEVGLSKTSLNDGKRVTADSRDNYVTIEQREWINGQGQNKIASHRGHEWEENRSTQMIPDYSSGDATSSGYNKWHKDSGASGSGARNYTDEWNEPNNVDTREQQHEYQQNGRYNQLAEDTRQLEVSPVPQNPVDARLSKVHQRLKGINKPRGLNRLRDGEQLPTDLLHQSVVLQGNEGDLDGEQLPTDLPHRSVVLQGNERRMLISVDNSHNCGVAGQSTSPLPCEVQLEYEEIISPEWQLESLKMQLRPMFGPYQLIGDNFFLNLARRPEINASCTVVGLDGKDFRCGTCVSGLTVADCCKQMLNARLISHKVVLMLGAMDILLGYSFTDLKIQSIGLMEILLEKSPTMIVLCTIPPLLTATEKQRECQLEYNKWIKGMVSGSRIFECCDLFSKFMTCKEMPVNDELFAKEAIWVDTDKNSVLVNLWNNDGCTHVIEELKQICV